MKTKKGNVAVIAIIVVIVAITAGVIGFFFAKKTQAPVQQAVATQPAPNTQLKQETSTAQSDQKQAGLIYTNTDYGYQIVLPNDWVGYKFIDSSFLLPTSAKEWSEKIGTKTIKGYADVFDIEVYSLAEWDVMKKDCGQFGGSNWHPGCNADSDAFLKNDKFVFTAQWPNSGPDVAGDSKWGMLAKEVDMEYLKSHSAFIGSTAQSDETVNWQTYMNEQYGYSLKYPAQWFAYTSNSSDVFFQIAKEDTENVQMAHADALEIEAIKATAGNNLNSLIDNQFRLKGAKYTKENIIIGGKEGIKMITSCDGAGCGSPEWFLLDGGYLFHISSNLGYTNMFDKILSTFKFTK